MLAFLYEQTDSDIKTIGSKIIINCIVIIQNYVRKKGILEVNILKLYLTCKI